MRSSRAGPSHDPAALRAAHPARRASWVVAELDAHGHIDAHTAMCLRFAVADALAGTPAEIVLDLRDLTDADEDAIAVLRWARSACRLHRVHLSLLIGPRAPSDALAYTLMRAGLSTRSL